MIGDPGSNPDCRTKKVACARCGEYVEKPFRYYRRAYHEECGIAEAADAARQMAYKSGPYYEKWRNSNARGADHKGRATPSDTTWADTFDASLSMRL